MPLFFSYPHLSFPCGSRVSGRSSSRTGTLCFYEDTAYVSGPRWRHEGNNLALLDPLGFYFMRARSSTLGRVLRLPFRILPLTGRHCRYRRRGAAVQDSLSICADPSLNRASDRWQGTTIGTNTFLRRKNRREPRPDHCISVF